MTDSLQAKLDDYFGCRRAYEEAKAQADKLYAAKQRLENEAIDMMLDMGTRSIGLADGKNVSLRKSFSCSVVKENFHAIREWLLGTVGDDADFVEETVSKPAVMELLRSKIDSGEWSEEEVPEFLRLNTRPTLSVRGWNKSEK